MSQGDSFVSGDQATVAGNSTDTFTVSASSGDVVAVKLAGIGRTSGGDSVERFIGYDFSGTNAYLDASTGDGPPVVNAGGNDNSDKITDFEPIPLTDSITMDGSVKNNESSSVNYGWSISGTKVKE